MVCSIATEVSLSSTSGTPSSWDARLTHLRKVLDSIVALDDDLGDEVEVRNVEDSSSDELLAMSGIGQESAVRKP